MLSLVHLRREWREVLSHKICFSRLVVAVVVGVVWKTHCSSIRRMNKAQTDVLDIQTLMIGGFSSRSCCWGPKTSTDP